MTRKAKTGGGGFHLYFAYPTGYVMTNKKPGCIECYEGVEFVGDVATLQRLPVVISGVVGMSGSQDRKPNSLRSPEWILDDLKADLPAGDIAGGLHPWTRVALEEECRIVGTAKRKAGGRNATLWESSLKLGESLRVEPLTFFDAFDGLKHAAEECGNVR